MMHKAWSGIAKVPYCFSGSSVKFRGHTGQKIANLDPNWAFPDNNFSLNSLMAMKWCIRLEATLKMCPIIFHGHSSNFKVTRDNESPILTRIERFRTVALVRIHRWLWNDSQSFKQHWRSALLFFKVSHQISKSQGTKNADFYPNWAFPDCNSSFNSPMALVWCTKLNVA